MGALNDEAARIFGASHAPLNHVLAQIYHNTPSMTLPGGTKQKQTKAKIKAHSDKTKDMPANGIMAFCTFYNEAELTARLQPLPPDPEADDEQHWHRRYRSFDFGVASSNCHKKGDLARFGTSGMTKLHFVLKKGVRQLMAVKLNEPFGEHDGSADGGGCDGSDGVYRLLKHGLKDSFTVDLYPGSVFFMPLSTNRLYTHEIRSVVPAISLLHKTVV